MIPVLSEYEQFVYSLQARFSSIQTSTLWLSVPVRVQRKLSEHCILAMR